MARRGHDVPQIDLAGQGSPAGHRLASSPAAAVASVAVTYRGPWLHAPAQVLSDLAVAVADGADAVSGIAVLTDRQEVLGQVASMPTAWRVLDRVDAEHLPAVRAARAAARQAAWAAGAGPDLGEEMRIGRRVATFVVVRTSMLEAQHRASTLS
jgi:hypothetical protein